jgi:hypothetical protein
LPDPADSIREQSHRLPRACYCGEVAVAYTARLVSGGEPIHRPRVAQAVISVLTASAIQHSCSVPIYCIMPDHVHVILQGTDAGAERGGDGGNGRGSSQDIFPCALAGFYDHPGRG